MSGSGISGPDDPANVSWGGTQYVQEGYLRYLGCSAEVQCLHGKVDRGQHVARGFNDARPPSRDDLVGV